MSKKLASLNSNSLLKKMNPRWLERITKAVANHRRIRVLQLLDNEPELTLSDICSRLEMKIKNGSEHVRKLMITGLVLKRRKYKFVHHRITNRGKQILSMLQNLT